jgi:uncharacterized phiE125 gp8 family phage protein
MPYTVTTPPAVEPLTLSAAKLHLGLDMSEFDGWVESKIRAARSYVEKYCRRGMVTQTVTLTADAFPRCCGDGWYEFDGERHRDGAIRLPWGRVQSVASVAYVDADGATQTWDASKYRVDTASEPGRITPAYGEAWPTTRCVTNAVTVAYVVGYGATAASVPEDVKHAMLLLLTHWWENRSAVNVGNITTNLDFSVEALLSDYRCF